MTRDPRQAHGHDLSRRDFLKRTAGAAVAIPAAAEILAACTKPGTTSSTGGLPYQIARPDNPVTLPMNGDPISSDTPIDLRPRPRPCSRRPRLRLRSAPRARPLSTR